jgi:hypothetical protein
MDSGELRNVDLSAASAIRFTDAKLQLQFRDYLAALTSSRSKDKRSVYIDSTDSKSRDVRRRIHYADAGVEIELPAAVRGIGRAADARRLGDCR